MIFQNRQTQKIIGVEFFNMGQRGIHGRYPLYFFLDQNLVNSTVSKNSIHQSKQRCVVLHGSWNLKLTENVAYDTIGHCFFLEDGVEFANTFTRNLVMLTVRLFLPFPPFFEAEINNDDLEMLPEKRDSKACGRNQLHTE